MAGDRRLIDLFMTKASVLKTSVLDTAGKETAEDVEQGPRVSNMRPFIMCFA